MSGWCRLLLPGLFLASWFSLTAQSLDEAARDLARQVAAATGSREAISFSLQNVSGVSGGEATALRRNLETELRALGVRIAERSTSSEIRITLSENLSRYLLVAEVQKGEERQVLIASAARQPPTAPPAAPPSIVIEKKLVWEQEEPILDLAFIGDGTVPPELLVLDRSRVSLYAQVNGHWEARQTQAIPAGRAWPRDLRGRLVWSGGAFRAYLPGLLCRGGTQPALRLECADSDEAWPLDAGTRLLGLADLAPNRNYFSGRVVTAPGGARQLAPFYTAASAEEQGNPLWIFAGVDGRARLFNSAWEPAGTVEQWGSDIAGLDAPCTPGHQILATRPGDFSEPDAVQAFVLVNREAVPASAPVGLPGPATALWPAGRSAAFVVSREPNTLRYAAFSLSLSCGS